MSGSASQNLTLLLEGHVQGVGLRPFLYRKALEAGLVGRIWNPGPGASADLDGPTDRLIAFVETVRTEVRPPIHFSKLEARVQAAHGWTDLHIGPPENAPEISRRLSIPPDRATCTACWADFHNPDHRLHGYPFISCTDCGPRWTILEALPFERRHTTLVDFPMCSACEGEYQDVQHRRFFAQTIGCLSCGPTTSLILPDRRVEAEPFTAVQTLLNQGAIGLVKGTGGYLLVGDAEKTDVIARIRALKRRPNQALAVMIRDQQTFLAIGGQPAAWERLNEPAAPIVSLPGIDLATKTKLAPDLAELGVMAPSTPFFACLFGSVRALVVCSANDRGAPIPFRPEDLTFRVGVDVDFCLDHHRRIVNPVDDSVVRGDLILRKSRGFSPDLWRTNGSTLVAVAHGADLKNNPAVALGDHDIELPYVGSLSDLRVVARQQDQVQSLLGRVGAETPLLHLCDNAPESATRQLATGQTPPVTVVEIPHHHAHAAAALREHPAELVLTFDGTGWLRDGGWGGGEGLRWAETSFETALTFRAFPLVGGDHGIRHPWRTLVTCLREAGIALADLRAAFDWLPVDELEIHEALLQRRPMVTTSVGRWFDAAAALIEFKDRVQEYEAQAPIRLEALASQSAGNTPVAPVFLLSENPIVIDGIGLLRYLFERTIERELEPPDLAFLAHDGLARSVAAAIGVVGAQTIVATGGVFQNELLFQLLKRHLQTDGRALFRPGRSPVNDQGIALGQLSFVRNARCTS